MVTAPLTCRSSNSLKWKSWFNDPCGNSFNLTETFPVVKQEIEHHNRDLHGCFETTETIRVPVSCCGALVAARRATVHRRLLLFLAECCFPCTGPWLELLPGRTWPALTQGGPMPDPARVFFAGPNPSLIPRGDSVVVHCCWSDDTVSRAVLSQVRHRDTSLTTTNLFSLYCSIVLVSVVVLSWVSPRTKSAGRISLPFHLLDQSPPAPLGCEPPCPFRATSAGHHSLI